MKVLAAAIDDLFAQQEEEKLLEEAFRYFHIEHCNFLSRTSIISTVLIYDFVVE